MIPLCQGLIHLYKTVYKSRVLDVLSKKHEQIDRKYIARIYSFAKGSMIKELENLKTKEHDAGLIFSGKSSNKTVTGYDKPNSFTPKDDPYYVFHESSRDIIVWFMSNSDPLYCFGPTGSGKTSLIKQLASKLNYPVFEITGHSRLE